MLIIYRRNMPRNVSHIAFEQRIKVLNKSLFIRSLEIRILLLASLANRSGHGNDVH